MLVNEQQPLLTIKQAAKLLNVSERTIRRMINDGRLDATEIRFSWRIRPEEIDRIREGKQKGE